MTVSPVASIDKALVHTLRFGHGPLSYRNSDDEAVLSGKWIHEGFAPEETSYPFFTYQRFPSTPRSFTWGSVMFVARYDVKVFSPRSVEADNLDALAAAVLDGASLEVAGQSTLICRRVADLSDQDVDDEGTKIYMAGGTYEVITDQPLPVSIQSGFTLDAVII